MSNETQPPELTGDRSFRSVRESVYRIVFFACAALSVLTTIGIILVLTLTAADFFAQYSVVKFLTGTEWTQSARKFGVLPLFIGTLMITVGSALIALPLGLLTAIYLSEYASTRTRSVLKPLLEILAGVPTVVYGYFALVYITPFLNWFISTVNGVLGTQFPTLGLFNALSASIVVGILIIPMVSSISEDAMSSVPDSLRNAGYGLGATKFEVSTSIVVPAAISGIASSFILAISRAIGETMAVTLAAGSQPAPLPEVQKAFGIPYVGPADLMSMYAEGAQTMTAAMVELATGDIVGGGLAYQSLYALGLTLFVITLVANILSDIIANRYREVYD